MERGPCVWTVCVDVCVDVSSIYFPPVLWKPNRSNSSPCYNSSETWTGHACLTLSLFSSVSSSSSSPSCVRPVSPSPSLLKPPAGSVCLLQLGFNGTAGILIVDLNCTLTLVQSGWNRLAPWNLLGWQQDRGSLEGR